MSSRRDHSRTGERPAETPSDVCSEGRPRDGRLGPRSLEPSRPESLAGLPAGGASELPYSSSKGAPKISRGLRNRFPVKRSIVA